MLIGRTYWAEENEERGAGIGPGALYQRRMFTKHDREQTLTAWLSLNCWKHEPYCIMSRRSGRGRGNLVKCRQLAFHQ